MTQTKKMSFIEALVNIMIGFGINITANFLEQYRAVSKDGISPSLASNTTFDKWNVDYGNWKIRRLTPTECERLQAFPDGWTKGISDTQRYKCLGNAVTVNVIQAIGDAISGSK